MLTQALLVDDSRSALDFLKRHVEADGTVQVTAFTDPLQAIASAMQRAYDLVLVDYEMPKMDGISFIRELRTFPQFAEIPFVMITSIEDDQVRMKALEAGATDFLPKRPQSLEMQVRLRNLIRLGLAVRKLNDRAADLASEVAAATRKLQEREEEIILRLALAVEYRDNDTGEHTLRVARYSRVIAEQLGLSPRLCRDIYLAAPLHDVGKVAIPDRILLKPGRLDADEMAVIRTHAGIGARILAEPGERLQTGSHFKVRTIVARDPVLLDNPVAIEPEHETGLDRLGSKAATGCIGRPAGIEQRLESGQPDADRRARKAHTPEERAAGQRCS